MNERITELFDEYYAVPKDDKPTPNKRIEAADELIEDYKRESFGFIGIELGGENDEYIPILEARTGVKAQ